VIGGTTPAAITGTTIQANTQFNAGSAGTLAPIVMGNATSGTLTLEPATGAITSYTLELPVAQPSGSNTFLSCTAANPSVCTFAAGGSVGPTTACIPTDLGTITYNASGTTTFAAASDYCASGVVTATHSTSTTFSPTGLVKWGQYSVVILQDSTGGGVTFTLGTGGTCSAWKISGGGSGAITLTATASARDILTFTYDGTNCDGTLVPNFS
jgi:hypothetical protein